MLKIVDSFAGSRLCCWLESGIFEHEIQCLWSYIYTYICFGFNSQMVFQDFEVPFTVTMEGSIKITIKVEVCAKTKTKVWLQRPWQVNSKNGLALKGYIFLNTDFSISLFLTLLTFLISLIITLEWLVFFLLQIKVSEPWKVGPFSVFDFLLLILLRFIAGKPYFLTLVFLKGIELRFCVNLGLLLCY